MLTENCRKWRQTIYLVISAISSFLYIFFYSKYKDKLNLIKIMLISGDLCVKTVKNSGCWEPSTIEVPYIFFFEKTTTFFIVIGYQRFYMYGIVMTYGIRCDYQLCKNMMFEEINSSTGGVCWFRSEVRLNLWYQHRKLLSTLANVGSISIWCACHQLDIGSMSTQVVWFIEWNACIPDVDLRSIGYHSA